VRPLRPEHQCSVRQCRYSSSEDNAVIALLEPWLQKWRIHVNTKKCAITLFSRRLRHYCGNMGPVKLFNVNIASYKECQYLGVTLDSKLTYRTHITNTLRKANFRLRQLLPILNQSSTIDINLALILYKSLLRSILTYACPVWGYAAKTYINKLQTFQNKVLRLITKLPRVTPIITLHEQTGMPLMSTHIKMLTRALYRRSARSVNSHIHELGQYDPSADKHLRPLSLLAK
jgi:hypothetical protein